MRNEEKSSIGGNVFSLNSLFFGLLSALAISLCCVGPIILSLMGLGGILSLLGSFQVPHHQLFNWIGLGLILLSWFILLVKENWSSYENSLDVFCSPRILILVGLSVIVLFSWTTVIL